MSQSQEEGVLNVLMYLFKHHMQGSCGVELEPDLFNELEGAGFSKITIRLAFVWLEKLNSRTKNSLIQPSDQCIRIYNERELAILDDESIDYIKYLCKANILNFETTELVIAQLCDLNCKIDISLVQWVCLVVLFNQDNAEDALAKMELLVLHDRYETIH
jgi:Smg protein